MRYQNIFSVSYAWIHHSPRDPPDENSWKCTCGHKDYYLLQLKLILTCMYCVMSIEVCRLNKRFSTFVANVWS